MIEIKTPEEIEIMREAGKILAGIVKKLSGMVGPGIETRELNKAAEVLVLASGGQCSFKGHEGTGGELAKSYPACLCVSVNEEVVHALPSSRVLREGDIVSLDLGLFWQGFHSDMAITLSVGKISPQAKKLIEVTGKSLAAGIEEIKPGNRFGDISRAIQKYVEDRGFAVVRELCGHGIGRELHEEPQILNCGKRGTGPKLVEGMVFCLEPMITAGDWRIKKSKDGFGYQTRDNSLSAHFEHTVAVTKDGYQILTGCL